MTENITSRLKEPVPLHIDGPSETIAFRVSPLERRRLEMAIQIAGGTVTGLLREGLQEACRKRLLAFAIAESPSALRAALKDVPAAGSNNNHPEEVA